MKTLLLCFANSNESDKRLETLVKEYETLKDLMEPGRQNKHFDVISEPYATIDKAVDKLQIHADSICLFHFSGHASETDLRFEDSPALGTGLAQLLAGCSNLGLVFLNGCSTQNHVNLLRASGVTAAIIATSSPVNDGLATQFSSRFYQALTRAITNPLSVEEALAETETYMATKPELAGIIILRGALEMEEPVDRNKWSVTGSEQALGWKLPIGLARLETLRYLRRNNGENLSNYFVRTNYEQQLYQILSRTGAVYISGAADSGKTTLLKRIIDQMLKQMIDQENSLSKPILYLDLSRGQPNELTDPRDWYARYNVRVAEVSHPDSVLPLFTQFRPSQAAIAVDDRLLTDWVDQFDQDKVTLVIDNISDAQWVSLQPLYRKSQARLKDSLMVFVKSFQPSDEPDLVIRPLNEQETRAFAEQHGLRNSIDTLFKQTRGNLLYLSLYSRMGSALVAPVQPDQLTENRPVAK